ncbi:hypothetical protein HDV06_004476 [Boothiomyces sp. JEL0866]|nr:hypothetical protein HDV06_004476 [Boothiomyces sp. JEL0866]
MNSANTRKIVSFAMLIGLLATFSILIALNQQRIFLGLRSYIEFIKNHQTIGAFIYVIILGVSSCFLVPTSYPTIVGGILFRPLPLAVVLTLAGSQVGIVLSFLIGKTLLRPWIKKQFSTDVRLRAIDHALLEEGTSIQLITAMMASLVGNLPGATLNSFIGSLFTSVTDAEKADTPLRAKLLSGLFGGCFFIGSTVFITIISRKALRNTVDLNSEPTSSSIEGDVNTENTDEQGDSSLEGNEELSIDAARIVPIVMSSQSSSTDSQALGNDSQEGLVEMPVEDDSRVEKGFTQTELNTMKIVCGFIVLALSVGVPVIFAHTTEKGTTWKP